MKRIFTIISLLLVLLTFSNCYFLHLTKHKIPIPDSILGIWEEIGAVGIISGLERYEVVRVNRFTVDVIGLADGDDTYRLTLHKVGNYTFASLVSSGKPMTLLLSEMSEKRLTFRDYSFNKTDSTGFDEVSNDIKEAYFISTVQRNGITAEEIAGEYSKKYNPVNGKNNDKVK